MRKLYINLYFLLCISLLNVTHSIASTQLMEEQGDFSDRKKNLMSTLTHSPEALMLDDNEQRRILQTIAEENSDCLTFGTVEGNLSSFNKWTLYSRSLYVLTLLGDTTAKEKLLEEFDRRTRRLDIIDCYANGKPYQLCLVGIWNQVASYNSDERKKLILAAEAGRIIPQSMELAAFWKSYQFSFDKINSVQ